MSLKNNRAPLLSNIKLCASFHHHVWIQTGVTVRKRLSWVSTSVNVTFDLWPWPFAWTSLWALVITPKNFMTIQWCEHGEKCMTDGETNIINHSYSWLVAAKNLACLQMQECVVCWRTPNKIWVWSANLVKPENSKISWLAAGSTPWNNVDYINENCISNSLNSGGKIYNLLITGNAKWGPILKMSVSRMNG